ncbi:hypothetical protein DPEC_G00018540 [Dallia pectoralis]|uniref:Uncharacterized protein n=2 Tax=Dallia pectoralis TaxID=75939 RepID=A0ACC2GR26_DALPE|nr:hypothetical protein DPEC_G00125850 [Dallia pectoralis]KAJ8014712.1 hypothetical protein DPEC_G00018540 [Dallia pectoralis]
MGDTREDHAKMCTNPANPYLPTHPARGPTAHAMCQPSTSALQPLLPRAKMTKALTQRWPGSNGGNEKGQGQRLLSEPIIDMEVYIRVRGVQFNTGTDARTLASRPESMLLELQVC